MYVSYTMYACVYVCIRFAFKNLHVVESTVNTCTQYREMVWVNITRQKLYVHEPKTCVQNTCLKIDTAIHFYDSLLVLFLLVC